MKRLLTALAALAGALLLAVLAGARPAAAHHEWFTPGAEYRHYPPPSYALTSTPHDRSGVVKKWREASSPLTWNSSTVDGGSGALDSAVRPTIAYLQATMSGGEFANLDWQEVSAASSPDVVFNWTPNLIGVCGTDTACTAITHGAPQSPEAVRYVTSAGGSTAQVFLNLNLYYSSNGMRATVLHELLHLYGLADDYSEDPLSPTAGTGQSIMGGSISGPGVLYGGGAYTCPLPLQACTQGSYANSVNQVHIVPTGRDLERLRAFWRGLEPSGYTGVPHHNSRTVPHGWLSGPGSVIAIGFGDYAWSENHAEFQYWKSDGAGGWTLVHVYGTQGGVGRHWHYTDAADRIHSFNLSVAGVPGGGAGDYSVCAVPKYRAATAPGAWESGATSCTPPFSVPA